MKESVKKTIAFALTLLGVLVCIFAPNAGKSALFCNPIVAEAATTVGDFTFTRRSTNIATVTYYTGTSSRIILPTTVTINGIHCKVTGIDDYAFRSNTSIKSVTIPYGYHSIGSGAFYYCTNLTNVYVPSSLAAIGDYAFYSTGIKSFTIPGDVKILGEYVFANCSKLTTANIRTNILTNMKEGMFSGCTSLRTLKFSPNSKITSLGKELAYGCSSLTNVSLPSNLTSIGASAFEGCSSLSGLNIPETVNFVGGNAFRDTLWINNQPLTNGIVIRNGIIIDGTRASGTIIIPHGITTIPASMFSDNDNITKVVLPDTLSCIGERAFQSCSNLTTVEMPNSIVEIPDYCFNNCTKLRSITLPDRVINIGRCSFNMCKSLKAINFPDYLRTIMNDAFLNCTALENITNILDYKNYNIADDAFKGCTELRKINGTKVASRSGYKVTVYKEKFVKQHFSSIEEIGFIQDFVDLKCSAVVDEIKAENPLYNSVQLARALENWLCATGCTAKEKWKTDKGNTNYPDDLNYRAEYHLESSVLLNGAGVCEGWAKAYNRLLAKAGIISEIVVSKDHSWNVIYADGKWFNVDSYWDNCGSCSGYKWFMVSDDEMYKMDNSGSHEKVYVKRKNQDNTYSDEREIIPCTTPMGDVNIDKVLDDTDMNWLQSYINTGREPDKRFNQICADMNFDGKIDQNDIDLLRTKIADY